MPLFKILVILLLCFIASDDRPEDKTVFISPVMIPLALSANFGELRSDHFHSGIDIRTQGVIGKEIVAPADGYVYRISVSPGGFGKALYLRHPSGYSTVYGHLDRFDPDIEKYVIDHQYQKKSFTVSLFPEKDKFVFRQGDIIAYSGNTGGSSGPHLHYEIRKSDSEMPVNPLLFEFGTGDNIEPVFEKLAIYPVNKNTLINGSNSVKKIDIAGGHGNYYVPAENEIRINGAAGFGIKTYDLLNDSYHKCAIYSTELKIDGNTTYRHVMNEFSFSETRYINSHIDYETYMRDRVYFERTFLLPDNHLSTYKDVVNRGIYNFVDNKIHHVAIEIRDVHDNVSTLTFKVRSGPMSKSLQAEPPDDGLIMMPYNRSNRFRAGNIAVSIPAGALYDTLMFSYKKEAPKPGMLSEIHHVHNKYTPVHRSYSLSIKPVSIPAGKESKMLIIHQRDDKSRIPLSGKMADGFMNAQPTTFGMFYVGIDTIPPVINASGFSEGSDLSSRREMRIRITDNLSGIKSYEPIIDGKWALFEYDQKNSVLIYKFDPGRITKGINHNLVMKVTDNRDNVSTFTCNFRW
ncbi:MAG TPA: M23 family peptidase [Bacteroidales bacterium]|nr:M23 family peptidase [Bacteroidales bacterium]